MPEIKMYTTAVCPYCVRAKALLKKHGVEHITEIHVDQNPQERENMMKITGQRTVPQIYIGQTHVGGFDDLAKLDSEGKLVAMLKG